MMHAAMRRIPQLLQPSKSVAGSVLLVAAIYVLTLCLLETRGFWIVDNANKFLQMQAILESGYRDYSLPWPGQDLDPDFEFNPLPPPFSHVEGGKLYSFYPPFFATISSIPFRLFGVLGLYLLSLLSSVLALAGLARLAGAFGLGPSVRHAVVLLAGLCTPIWFYSVVFWEHMPAVCLAIWGIAFLLRSLESGSRSELIAGCLLTTLGVYFRDELYLLCAVLVAMAILCSPSRRLRVAALALITMGLGILPLWAFQWLALGHPLGFHIVSQAAAGPVEHLLARPVVLYILFLAAAPQVWASIALTAPFALGFVWNPRLSAGAFERALPVYAGVAAACGGLFLVGGYAAAESPILWVNQSNGLFSAAPILLLAFARPRLAGEAPEPARLAQRLWLIALAYSALYLLASPLAGSSGIHWGNRLLLVLYPILVLPAAANLVRWLARHGRRRMAGTIALALVVLVGAGAQVYSIQLLQKRKEFSYRLSREIQRRPEQVVITPVWWAPQDLFAAFYDKAIFHVPTEDQADRLLARLRRAKHDRFLFVAARGTESRGTLVARVEDEGLGYFALDFLRLETR
jgi:hypothetical protein